VLQLVDESIEAFLRATVPLEQTEVAIAFEAPDRQWSAGISQPTVNVFLWDIHRDGDRARAGVEEIVRDGRTLRRRALPRIELCYLVTAWTTDHRDEHQLLGEVMRAILATPLLTPPYLRSPLDQLEPLPAMLMGSGDSRKQSDLWKAIDGQLKPGLDLMVSLVVDPGMFIETAREPEAVAIATTDRHRAGMRPSVRDAVAGRVVDDPRALVAPPRPPVLIEEP
jgi:hypothetical protein